MSGEQHRRPAAAKTSSEWHRKVQTELFERPHRKQVTPANQQGEAETKYRWDPYSRFTDKDELTKFFSGHDYRLHHLVDRERFAKYSIRKTLDRYPNDDYDTTGEIMKNESVVGPSDESETLEDLENAIKADGQQDVDAEIPKELAARSSKAEENEFTQKISAAAQSFIAASPNSLGPPINACVRYLKMTQCGQYGRSNSTVWKSPFIPNLNNADGRRGLLDHQVTAIVWLLSRLFGDLPLLNYNDPSGKPRSNKETISDFDNFNSLRGPKYFGGILADSMGLGKTLITVALVDLLISQGLNVVRTKKIVKHRPIILMAPNATVANQWIQEWKQVIDESILHQIIVSGPGLEAADDEHRVVYLGRESLKQWPACLSYVWDENNEQASKVVFIVTMESWATRTCISGEEGWVSTFTTEKRKFSLVIVDEAYKVKNHKTKNWRSVYLLERQFTLLITATPCMNSLTDIFALARLLWTAPQRYLKKDPVRWNEIEKTFTRLEDFDLLDKYPSWHDFQLVAGRPALLARMLFKGGKRTHDINLTRQYLRHFESLAMLKRSPSSYIYADWEKTVPRSLDGLFPKVDSYTVDIIPGAAYDQEYQNVHIDLLIRYLEGIKSWERVKGRGKKAKVEEEKAKDHILKITRLLQIASSSLDVYDFNTILLKNEHSTLANEVAEMRENEVNFLRLAQFLVLPTEAKPNTHIGWMAIATRNSPILRYILQYIDENVLIRKENGIIKKLLIIEHSPVVAFYYELVLQFLGFECRCLHAQLSLDERQKLVDSFNSNGNESCQILIQMYTVGFAGTNLHKSCSQVLVAAQSHSLQVQWQAIHRVIRVGQNSDVTVHRVKLKNSYHTFLESRQIEKILPELGARAHGNTKKVLVRLLNLFQNEIREAWNSPEGRKLRQERNLLEDDDSDEEADSVAPHRIKKEEETESSGFKRIKREEEAESPAPKRCKFNVKPLTLLDDNQVKEEEEDFSGTLFVSNTIRPGLSSKAHERKPMPGDGTGGWYHRFLWVRTRDKYYQEFMNLPQEAKSVFSHSKNNLRRLLSYGNDNGALSTTPWDEDDLENPAVLERALELMLRVRLGAKDIAMLPFPLINLSQASARRLKQLQRLLADTNHTDQDLSGATSPAGRDSRETMKGIDLQKSLAEIDKDLEAQARHGDDSGGGGGVVKKEVEKVVERKCIDLTDDPEPLD
ncbi:P-loop containing nucleoside triphosphate hydrolase protein [Xylaria arbuscula]|nr:P-loop containing nucleoside triphosphate hydrolase protein [Xylaria arbuscula]